jgi:putative hydrolase of the HAD superfamily
VIRAVLFDAGGVLLHRRIHEVLARWDEALGLERDTFLFALYGGTDETVLVGNGEVDDHWAAVALGLGLDSVQARRVRDELDAAVTVDSQLASFLAALRPRCCTAIVTNGWADVRAELGRHGLDGLVDELVVSAEVGVAKPDPAILELTLERLGAVAAEAVLVDDSEENVAAAEALGMHGVRHVNRIRTIAEVEALLAP